MAEATTNGMLFRQHQPMQNVLIPARAGRKHRIQRGVLAPTDVRPIACNSQFVSKMHCEIYHRDKAFWLKDLGSTNGTFINGVSITSQRERELRFGDMIGLGVSHNDSFVEVTTDKYFVFLFDKEPTTEMEDNTEVIDLEDEPSVVPNGVNDNNVVPGSSKEKNGESNQSEEEIEILCELPTPSADTSSNGSSSRKSRPPVPPPPIFSPSLVAQTPIISDQTLEKSQQKKSCPASKKRSSDLDSDTSTSDDFETPIKNKKFTTHIPQTSSTNKQPPKSDSMQTGESSSSSKRVLDDQNIKCLKRARIENERKIPNYDSSDDSSDGLDDSNVTNQRRKLKNTSIKSSSAHSNSNFIESHGPTKESSVTSKQPCENQKENRFQSTSNGKIRSRNTTSVDATSDSDNKVDNEVRRDNIEVWKDHALKSKVYIRTSPVIYFDQGRKKYLMRRDLLMSFSEDNKNKMEKDFRESLKKFGKNEKLLPEVEASSSDEDKLMSRKRTRHLSPTPSDSEESSESFPEDTSKSTENKKDTEPKQLAPISPNAVVTSGAVQKSPTVVEKAAPRAIKLINDAPLPRFAARAQNRAVNFPKPHSPFAAKLNRLRPQTNNEPEGGEGPLSKENLKNIRSMKLKDVELKKRLEKEETASPSPEKRSQPAKIKMTTRNRNQGLMESIIGSELKDDHEEENLDSRESAVAASHHSTEHTVVENGLSGKETSKPPPSAVPSVVMPQSHSSKIGNNSTFKLTHLPTTITNTDSKSHSHNTRINNQKNPLTNQRIEVNNEQRRKTIKMCEPVPGPSRLIREPTANKVLLKAGANAILSPPGEMGHMRYREKPGASAATTSVTTSAWKPFISEDDIFIRIFGWRPSWLQEQKERAEPPPVLQDLILRTAVVNYQSYDDYVNTYYPLLLSEIWHVISNDVGGSRSKNRNDKASEYKVKVTEIKRDGFCAFARPKNSKVPLPSNERDESWCSISCESWLERANNRCLKKDFVILTVHGKEKHPHTSAEEPKTKDIFGFVIYNKEQIDPIGGSIDCDPRLKAKGVPGYRLRETIQCRFNKNFTIDWNQLGQLNKISYIMPKVREFRAMNGLQSSRLFGHIISPPKITQPWNPKYPPLEVHQMIRICHQLNNEQKSMVNYISTRVFSNDPELMLMHGPPGTGKTKTIVALVLQLLVTFRNQKRKGYPRILICTPSNAAIDEIIRRLIEGLKHIPTTDQKIDLIRVGESSAKELEKYTVSYRAREKQETKSNTKTLQVELEALNLEVEEKKKAINGMKNNSKHCPIQLEALYNERRDLERKLESVLQDINVSKKKGKSAPISGEKAKSDVIRDANIICATLSASSNSLMRNVFGNFITKEQKPFLCCIIDEASQTTETETLLTVALQIDKLILVGDPQQLGATVLSPEAEKKNYGQSLFTRMFHYYNRTEYGLPSPVMMLRRQYRMQEEIVHFPNAYSYKGKLESHYKKPDGYLLRPYYFFNLSSGRESSSAEGQIENVEEIELVKVVLDVIQQVLQNSKKEWTVGVITPYSRQRDSIRNELQSKTYSVLKDIQVDTVDGFQGQERDIIILSCVRTESTGFLKSPNRLNVALTRAKHSLYIIGDMRCLSQDGMWKCLIQDAANRGHKYDVKHDFQAHLKMLSAELITNLRAT